MDQDRQQAVMGLMRNRLRCTPYSVTLEERAGVWTASVLKEGRTLQAWTNADWLQAVFRAFGFATLMAKP